MNNERIKEILMDIPTCEIVSKSLSAICAKKFSWLGKNSQLFAQKKSASWAKIPSYLRKKIQLAGQKFSAICAKKFSWLAKNAQLFEKKFPNKYPVFSKNMKTKNSVNIT